MANRRVWSSLSPAYQARLSRAGITQDAYESGVSLKGARGHAQTPEHPRDAVKQPSKYQKYRQNVASLQQQVWERKQNLWDTRIKWWHQRAKENVFRRKASDDGVMQVPGARVLRKLLAASDDEWEQRIVDASFMAANHISDDWNSLFYH